MAIHKGRLGEPATFGGGQALDAFLVRAVADWKTLVQSYRSTR